MLAAFPLLLAAASPQSVALADNTARPAAPAAAPDDTAATKPADAPAPAPEPQADPQAAPTPGATSSSPHGAGRNGCKPCRSRWRC
jgi:iron complex outermembrane receptor protein